MLKNKKYTIAFLILASSLGVGCSKKAEIKDNNSGELLQEKVEESKNKTLSLTKKDFKDINELKAFSKDKIKEFENILISNKIDYIESYESDLIINRNMTYEKYTKEFNQLAYTQISKNYSSGSGYLKTGLKLNIHLQEQISIENNFIKSMFDVIKLYNPDIEEKDFNEDIKNATSKSDDTSEKDINTGVEGITLKVYSDTSTNERTIVLSVRQELGIPQTVDLQKEYKTVKEFKEDSEKLNNSIEQKIDRINEVLKNSYIGKYKDVEIKLNNFSASYEKSFNQSFDIEYKGTRITGLQDEMLLGLYELIESVAGKDSLSKTITADEFKSYVKGLTIYTGVHTTGTIIDELGDAILPNSLPFSPENLSLSISYVSSVDKENKEENSLEEDKNSNSINVYDAVIKLAVNVPIKAEGVTGL